MLKNSERNCKLEALRELEVLKEREIQPVEARSGNLRRRTAQGTKAGQRNATALKSDQARHQRPTCKAG